VIVGILNDHFTFVTEAIDDEQGMVNKYMGDSVLGAFGIPFSRDDDATRAVSSALRMKAGLEMMNSLHRKSGKPVLKMGVGISTGQVICGTMGPARHMEYTLIGDSVNISKTLQRASRTYGIQILVDDKTKEDIRDRFHTREIDTIAVKNRSRPINVYEVLGPGSTDLPENIQNAIKSFELGLYEYRQQQWDIAILHFSQAVQVADDHPSKIFLERCNQVMEGSIIIPDDWDKIWKV
jgi:adenylate cyclase